VPRPDIDLDDPHYPEPQVIPMGAGRCHVDNGAVTIWVAGADEGIEVVEGDLIEACITELVDSEEDVRRRYRAMKHGPRPEKPRAEWLGGWMSCAFDPPLDKPHFMAARARYYQVLQTGMWLRRVGSGCALRQLDIPELEKGTCWGPVRATDFRGTPCSWMLGYVWQIRKGVYLLAEPYEQLPSGFRHHNLSTGPWRFTFEGEPAVTTFETIREQT